MSTAPSRANALKAGASGLPSTWPRALFSSTTTTTWSKAGTWGARRLADGADDERDEQRGALHGDSTSRLRQKWKPTKAASASTTITAPPISP